MTKEEILKIFEQIKELESIRSSIEFFIMDKKNSFEDRLEVFVNTPKQFYTTKSHILNFQNFDREHGEISWFEDFYFERYEEVDLTEIVEHKDEYSYTADWSDEKFRSFQEAILDAGYHSFKLDW